jgi:hypothetical protein
MSIKQIIYTKIINAFDNVSITDMGIEFIVRDVNKSLRNYQIINDYQPNELRKCFKLQKEITKNNKVISCFLVNMSRQLGHTITKKTVVYNTLREDGTPLKSTSAKYTIVF